MYVFLLPYILVDCSLLKLKRYDVKNMKKKSAQAKMELSVSPTNVYGVSTITITTSLLKFTFFKVSIQNFKITISRTHTRKKHSTSGQDTIYNNTILLLR